MTVIVRGNSYAYADFLASGYAANHPTSGVARFPTSLVADFLTEIASPAAPASTTALNGTEYTTALFAGSGYAALFPSPFFADLLAEMAAALGQTWNGSSLVLNGHTYTVAMFAGYGRNDTNADTSLPNFPDSVLTDFLTMFRPVEQGAVTFTRSTTATYTAEVP